MNAVIEARDVAAGYGFGRARVPVVRGVSLAVAAGGAHAIVGESGSGKSTFSKVLVGELAPLHGSVLVAGTELSRLRGRARRAAVRRVQMITQDPYAALDPRMTIGQSLLEACDPTHTRMRAHAPAIAAALETVGLPADAARRHPRSFSGGQRQRIVTARALLVEPDVIVADEPTSSLDASVQAEILDLFVSLKRERDLAFVLITHDLDVARYVCDAVTVLRHGDVVEQGPIALLDAPHADYTRALLASVPDPEGRFLLGQD